MDNIVTSQSEQEKLSPEEKTDISETKAHIGFVFGA